MLFLLSTPDYTKFQLNTTKIKVHLRNGFAEIYDQHQDLIGKVENDLVEIESNFENKLEKFLYILQDGVFIVSNKGLENNNEKKETGVYVYARRVREINQNTSLDEIVKQYEEKKDQLQKEFYKIKNLEEENKKQDLAQNAKTLLLKDEVYFLRRAIAVIKGLKN